MKITCPPPQVIFVGFESNQQGQAASQEHASSSCPDTFHDVFFSSADTAAARPARSTAMTRNDFVRIFESSFSSRRQKHTAAEDQAERWLRQKKSRWLDSRKRDRP